MIAPRWYQSRRNVLFSEAGFTLMEIIVVMALGALLLTISIPTLRNNLYTNELKSSARKLIGTVKELRNLAVRDQQAYYLHFDFEKNSIWHEPDDGDDPFENEPENVMELNDVRLEDVQTYSQGSKNGGVMSVWISRQGYMDQTLVHLRDEEDKVITLLFSPFSGSARVYEEYVELEEE